VSDKNSRTSHGGRTCWPCAAVFTTFPLQCKRCAGADRRESAREHTASSRHHLAAKKGLSGMSPLGHGLKLCTRCVDPSACAPLLFSTDERPESLPYAERGRYVNAHSLTGSPSASPCAGRRSASAFRQSFDKRKARRLRGPGFVQNASAFFSRSALVAYTTLRQCGVK
jgi:hypothetical protein